MHDSIENEYKGLCSECFYKCISSNSLEKKIEHWSKEVRVVDSFWPSSIVSMLKKTIFLIHSLEKE